MGQKFVLLKDRNAAEQENNCDVKHLLTDTKADVKKTGAIFDLISGIESLTDIHCM